MTNFCSPANKTTITNTSNFCWALLKYTEKMQFSGSNRRACFRYQRGSGNLITLMKSIRLFQFSPDLYTTTLWVKFVYRELQKSDFRKIVIFLQQNKISSMRMNMAVESWCPQKNFLQRQSLFSIAELLQLKVFPVSHVRFA